MDSTGKVWVQRSLNFEQLYPDELKIKKYTQSKRRNSKRDRGIEFYLTEEDIVNLLDEAGITIWDVGLGKGAYCLGRYGDKGDYTLGNCRFITHQQNGLEWWTNLTPEEQEQRKAQARKDGKKGAKYGHLGGYHGRSGNPQKTIR
jgi:hypothetical protein